MNMNTRAKALIGAVAIGGAAIAMGGAFTAGGLSTSGDAAAPVVIGGEVTQEVKGATITGVTYELDSTQDNITGVAMTFGSNAYDTQTVTVNLDGKTGSCQVSGTTANCPFEQVVPLSGSSSNLTISVEHVGLVTVADPA